MSAKTSFGVAHTARWAVAESSLLLLALVLASAWRTLWRRCGRRFDPWLLAALLLTVLLAWLPLQWTLSTQHQLDVTREYLTMMKGTATQPEIHGAATAARDALAATEPSVYWIVAGCFGVGLLLWVGLRRRLNIDYWRAKP